MTILGAILAGGNSSRFGSDKAAANMAGKPLLSHVIEAMLPQVDALVICGREWTGHVNLADHPANNLGPLGGLCAALRYAALNEYDHVLSTGCDVVPVPSNLSVILGEGPAHIENQPLLAVWPAALAARLERHLLSDNNRSLFGWAEACGARIAPLSAMLYNINTQDDLTAYCGQEGIFR